MMDARVFPRSAECPDFFVTSLNPDALLPYKENVDLTYDGKRLQWNKSFEDLKKFIANVVGLNGKWTSPEEII